MPDKHPNGLEPAKAELDLELAEAVNQLVWFIADEFVDAYREEIWLREMLPEPASPVSKTATG